ncbi:lactate utilization protein [Anaerovorax odorimutans]|uniref:lactate utilization protein n=1 Tax=Anaerovorax odorimutans TaxID=109327 RepID=UPI00041C0E0B|nr:lactate utilization protein [Anaerovorax odorimutans]
MELKKAINALKSKGYEVSCFETAEEAKLYIDCKVDGRTVGFGDSVTLGSMKLYDVLSSHNKVIDPIHCVPGMDFWSTAKQCLTTDIFFTSVNALAETGEMVNIDGTGNRVAGSLFGHEKVYFIVGANKVVSTLDDAIWRAQNVAAPRNAARHGFQTPCAIRQDHCYDCKSPDRICCGQMIYYQKMRFIEMEVVLIKETLGF